MARDRSETISVLHVDDEPELADVVKAFLERESDRLRVETATNVDDALDRVGEVDCVVSDYDMPDRNGIEFLERVRERRPNLPYILYTGKGSEEVASEAISKGVTDYLQKTAGSDQYAILANRIVNAVEGERSRRRADQRRHRLRQILKTVPTCVTQLDAEGNIVYANERAEDVLGLQKETVESRTYNDPDWKIRDLDGDPIPDERLPFRQVIETGEQVRNFRHTIETPDGTRKVLEIHGAPVFDDDGTVVSAVFSDSDITGRIERERRLETTTAQLETVFEHVPEMILVHDGEGTIQRANERIREELGYEDVCGMAVRDIDTAVDPQSARANWSAMAPDERRPRRGEYRRADGSTVPVETVVVRVDARDDRFLAIGRVVDR